MSESERPPEPTPPTPEEPPEVRQAREDAARPIVLPVPKERAEGPRSLIEAIFEDPAKGAKLIKLWEELQATLTPSLARMTYPEDWTLFRDPEGGVRALLTGPGAERVARYLRITFSNYRDLDGLPIVAPKLTRTEKVDARQQPVWKCEHVLDAYSELLHGGVEAIDFVKHSDEDWIGRKSQKNYIVPLEITLRDMQSATFMGARARATRMIAGLTRVPFAALAEYGIAVGSPDPVRSRCLLGHGFDEGERDARKRDRQEARASLTGATAGGTAPTAAPARTEKNGTISDKQYGLLWGRAYGRVGVPQGGKADEAQKDQAGRLVQILCDKLGVEKSRDLPAAKFDEALNALKTLALPGEGG
jgi:hypothetical protein